MFTEPTNCCVCWRRRIYLLLLLFSSRAAAADGRPNDARTCVPLTCVPGRPYTMTSRARFYILLRTLDFVLKMDFFFFLLLPPTTDTPYERPRSYERRRENELQSFVSLYCSICIIRRKHAARSDTYIHTRIRVYRRSNLRI